MDILADKTTGLLPFSRHRLYSLRDMVQFFGYDFIQLLSQLEREGANASSMVRQNGRAHLATPNDRKRLTDILSNLLAHCNRIGLANSHNKILHALSRTNNTGHYSELPFLVVESELSGIHFSLMCDLQKRKFASIEESKSEYFQRDDLFGNPFHIKSGDKISSEIKAIGNCLAANLNTAAIFHAIRVAELGMRRMASRFRVVVYRDKKRIKIQDATWNELINGIREKIKSEKRKPKAERKLKSHFRDYEMLADQLNRLKDDRNEVMHTHGEYKTYEALSVFERVKDFMQRLATRISLK